MSKPSEPLKIEKFDPVPPCTKAEQHRFIHDGFIWVLPGEPQAEWPYFWKCLYCELQIRTKEVLPKIEFAGDVLDE